MTLLLLLALQDDVHRWVEELRTDSIERREAAMHKLKDLGAAAVPELEKAAKDADAEVASRAQWVLRVFDLRTRLSPRLLKAMPGVEERLASDQWTQVFLELEKDDRALRNVRPEDVESLALPALKHAGTSSDRRKVCHELAAWDFRSAIPDILKLLADEFPDVRIEAVDALVSMKAVEAAGPIEALLADADTGVRTSAVLALFALRGKQAGTKCVRLLNDPDPGVRFRTAEMLGKHFVRESASALLGRLTDPAGFVREQAAQALVELKVTEIAPDLLSLLASSPARGLAARVLGAIRWKPAVPGLRKLLKDPDAEVRIDAAGALYRIEGTKCIPDLVDLTADESSQVRASLVETIGSSGRKAHVDRLVPLLKDAAPAVRIETVRALCRLEGRTAVPRFLSLVLDEKESADVRHDAFELIVDLDARESATDLISLLRSADPRMRDRAVETLSEWRIQAAAPDLVRLLPELDDPDKVMEALRAMKAPRSIPELLLLLKTDYRPIAWSLLGDLRAKEAIPTALELFQGRDSSARTSAIAFLRQVGAREAIPILIRTLADSDEIVRFSAVEALRDLGAREASPNVRGLLNSEERDVRVSAVRFLGWLHVREALPDLRRALTDLEPSVRCEAAFALGTLPAPEAISDLTELLDDPERDARLSAASALVRLGARQGVPPLFESSPIFEPLPLLVLNALRSPESWRRLREMPIRGNGEGPWREVLLQLTREAGLILEVEAENAPTSVQIFRAEDNRSVLDALENSLDGFEFVLEQDRLRVLPRTEAEEFWRRWWLELDNKK